MMAFKRMKPDRKLKQASIQIEIQGQPTDTTCGPTCLQAIYDFYGYPSTLEGLIEEIPQFEGGGTIAVHLANHALAKGFEAEIHTFNLVLFDPTWFGKGKEFLHQKIRRQIELRTETKRVHALKAYDEFLSLGGELKYKDLSGSLIRGFLTKGIPILTGLSATYLYQTQRENPLTNVDDDENGEPVGHFVILSGYHRERKTVEVADPFANNPLHNTSKYETELDRVRNAILLGVLTYDANLLTITPKGQR